MSGTSVTQEEVESLFDKDGDLREEPQEQEETQTEEQEEQTKDDTQEEQPEEEELNWDTLDPRYKSVWEKTQSEAQKWKSDYAKIQSHMTKQAKARQEMESRLAEYQAQAERLSQWEALLGQHRGLEQHIQQFLAKASNPLEMDVPDYLKDDPAFRAVQEKFVPYVQQLEQKLQMLEKKTGKIDEYERSVQEQQYKQQLDAQLAAAGDRIKAMFGRDATEEEITQVLEYMVENKYYNNGAAAAVAVFQDQYEKAVKTRYETEMAEKAKKFPARNKSVNGARAAAPSKDAETADDAVRMAFAEHGIQ